MNKTLITATGEEVNLDDLKTQLKAINKHKKDLTLIGKEVKDLISKFN